VLNLFLVALAALQVLDVVTTVIGLDRGLEEMNPLALNGHVAWLITLKVVVFAFIWWAAHAHPRRLYAETGVALLVGFYVFVIANNVANLRQV
jgi:hypothetical protein